MDIKPFARCRGKRAGWEACVPDLEKLKLKYDRELSSNRL